jgi:guanylate kinase
MRMNKKVIIFSAPSGSGKSTVVNHLLTKFDNLEFSISATSRAPRGQEQNGREYYFLSEEEFRRRISADEFVEYEEVYPGSFYGTLKSEMERIWSNGNIILFDVDVKGGINLKKLLGDQALSVFIKAPSIKELRRRLQLRGTDSPEAIEERVVKARSEVRYASGFDVVLVNDDLNTCLREAEETVKEFIERPQKKVALFFGTFNPMHTGHLEILRYLKEHTEADEVRVVVSPQNPMKRKNCSKSARLKNVKAAIARSGLDVKVSDVEYHLQEPLYTINTLRYLREKEPACRHIMVIGADNLSILSRWYRYQELIDEFEIWVYPRNGVDAHILCEEHNSRSAIKGIRLLEGRLHNISSTEIRNAEKLGKDMSAWKA